MQRLLVVEDDNSVRSTITTFLELEGYAVDAVSSTREALERLRNDAYPIVISDIYLDEKTGLDVLESARKNNPNCAVILMTGRGSIETVMKATQGGAFDYIAKPFELDTMLDTVKHTPSAIDVHAADRNDPANDSAERTHQRSRLATRAKNQVDHNLRRKLSDLVPTLRQSVAVPLDLPYVATGAVSATVKHGNVMSRPAQLPHQW